MNNRNLVFGAAGLLIVSLFLPVVSFGATAPVTLMNYRGSFAALYLLACAVAAVILAVKSRDEEVVWPGIASVFCAAVTLGGMWIYIHQTQSDLNASLAGNPFASQFANTFNIQWGWVPILAGATLLMVGGLRSAEKPLRPMGTELSKWLVGGFGLALGVLMAQEITSIQAALATRPDGQQSESSNPSAPIADAKDSAEKAEKANYIRDNLQVYDLVAKRFDSVLDGSIPGVRFKIKNHGSRTLEEVDVKVEFLDGNGNPIAEQTYYPVLAGGFDSNGPLRPNYVYQGDPDEFYQAKNVPNEWEEGKARASITDIKFAEDGK